MQSTEEQQVSPRVADLENAQRDQEQPQQNQNAKGCNWRYWGLRLVLIAVIIALIIYGIADRMRVTETFQAFVGWIQENPIKGPILLTFVYALAVVTFIPGSILTLGAGIALQAAYENTGLAVVIGTLAVWVGAEVGSCLAFLLGRYIFRNSVAEKAKNYKVLVALERALQEEGAKFTFLMRLCPLVPFNAFNFVMGVTSVQFWSYALGGLGMIPGTAVYVFIGTTISNIVDVASGDSEITTLEIILLIVGTILAFVGIVFITLKVRKYLNEQIMLEEEKKRQEQAKMNLEQKAKANMAAIEMSDKNMQSV